MRKILSALLNSITGQRRGNLYGGIRYIKQSEAALTRKFFADNLRRIIVLSLIPLTLLGSLSIFITDRYIRQSVEQNSESRLDQLTELTQVIPSELDSLSLSFDKDPKIKIRLQSILNTSSFTYEELEALFYLRNVIDVPANSKPYIHSIYIYYDNPYGRYLTSRDGMAQLDSSLDKDWLMHARRTGAGEEEFFTELRNLPTSTGPDRFAEVITVYKPFSFSSSGSFQGLIVMNVLPSYFQKSLLESDPWPGSYYYMTDRNGIPLVHSESFPGVVPMKDNGARFSYNEAWVNVKDVPRLAWKAVSVIPSAALYSLPSTIVRITLALCLLSLLLSAAYALWITRKNYRQLSQIIHVLDSADAAGDQVPAMPEHIHDVYELIVRNILQTFLEQKYLRVQLSERQARMELVELKALQSQMNPHFISNTLHSIYWKTFQLTRSPNEACLMIERLSDLLEYSLRAADEAVLLRDELTNVRSYVELQRTRFGSRLTDVWDIGDGTEECRVVKISLQPLVENSIHIGFESEQRLTVKIKSRLENGRLKVTVIDDGPGIAKERLAHIRRSLENNALTGKHVGLANTSKRLSLHYGSGGLLRIMSREGSGTAVTLIFPQEPF
ncbi:sensor histidine kinase [Paenibacillus chartarius]|uniref:histidine kinase n=1 Tax=Paenibacillus chartarius TaxID=747481 RepID=A0ABV6DN50_9BACL